MTPILGTHEGIEAFSKRGPSHRMFSEWMQVAGNVEIVEHSERKRN